MSKMHERAHFDCSLEVDGRESARDLLYALLVDRGHPHVKDVLTALDDLGLEVVER